VTQVHLANVRNEGIALKQSWESREQWERRLQNQQRNIVFPDTERNNGLVNNVIWKTPPQSLIQRIGIVLIALPFFGVSGIILFTEWSNPEDPMLLKVMMSLLAVPSSYLGGKALKNAFRRADIYQPEKPPKPRFP